tara:strand:+ start:2832 stop:3791 length:960 start_codon:yes stop_codon:yes gene_type:complete
MKAIIFLKKNIIFFFLYSFLIFTIFFDLLFSKHKYDYTFFIKSKETLNKITENLYQQNIINNKFLFKLFVRITFAEKKLKAGEYKFYNDNIFEIISKLKKGDVYLRKLTIPEGLSTKEIIEIIKNEDGIYVDNSINFEEIKEGELFPSTYFYAYGTNYNIIINNMKKRMKLILEKAWKNRDENLNLNNYNEVLILASIIEKETSLNYEKPIIAQVFLKRLKLNMKLQSDPTVIYGMKKEIDNTMKEIDLKHDSKFNTYLYYGLPIGPICNPGEDSIVAATKPNLGDFLYFVADGKGGHNFSNNFKEHLLNIDKLRKYKQ